MLLSLFVLMAQAVMPSPQNGLRVEGPRTWVAFSAELKIEHPSRPTAYGRQLQDEHGCTRRETVHPDGSLLVTILNFETQKMYRLMRGSWTSQPMRLVPSIARRPPVLPVHKKTDAVEGFEAYVSISNVTGPTGEKSTREAVVVPALNYFEVVQQFRPGGERIRAQNIKLGSPDHAEFLPPPGAAVAESTREGGSLVFQSVNIRVRFPDGNTVDLSTTEEHPVEIRTPLGDRLHVVTRVLDDQTDRLRVRVMKNAVWKGPGRIDGELLDEVELPFTGSAMTTKLVENFTVSVTRVGLRTFSQESR